MPGLLATKLHRPSGSPKRVERPRLIQKLDLALAARHPLILVSAPAGFGKTTCISAWIDTLTPMPAAWLSLEAMDNDPARFFTYFAAALKTVDERLGLEMSGILRSGQLPPAGVIGESLLCEIQDHAGVFLLVLDDFHVIQDNLILAVIEKLVANAPAGLRLVIITREDPPLPLARLRAHASLTEIRADDLRFTATESDLFLNSVMTLGLSIAEVSTLNERTEGWVVGLQLAGLSLRDQISPAHFISSLSGSHRHILGYFTEEVLRRQTEETRQFLLAASILERLNGDLCNHVVGRTDSAALLETLFTANLFLIPIDDEGEWFRFHHLFAELLQAQLRQTYPAEKIIELHRRAANWYDRHGWVNEAVDHILAANDYEGAARLIELNSPSLMVRGELVTIMQWIEALPPEIVQRHPMLLISKAWTLTLAGAIRQVEPLLCQTESQIEPGDESPLARELRGNASAIRGFFAMVTGDYPRALEQAERAEGLLPESSVNARALLPYTLGAAYRSQGRYEKALEAFSRVVHMGLDSDDFITWATGTTEIANTRRSQGRLRDTADICHQALQRMADRGVLRFGSIAKVEVPLIEVLREQNYIEEAHKRVLDVMARMQGWAIPTDRIFAWLALIHIQQAQGNTAGAFESLQAAKELKARNPVLIALASAVDFAKIRLNLDMGDPDAAARLVDRLAAAPNWGQVRSLHEPEQLLLARVRLAQGHIDETLTILSTLANDPDTRKRKGVLIEILVLQAVAMAASDGKDQTGLSQAIDRLFEALTLAEPEGFVRVFVDEGVAVQRLLFAAMRRIENSDESELMTYKTAIAKLLNAFPGSQTDTAPDQGLEPAKEESLIQRSLVEPLTYREQEVLRLISDGLSYAEIAGQLFISVNTVRTYIKGIYGKLAVNSRSKATALARELKLI